MYWGLSCQKIAVTKEDPHLKVEETSIPTDAQNANRNKRNIKKQGNITLLF
jgi:hypothetical protein